MRLSAALIFIILVTSFSHGQNPNDTAREKSTWYKNLNLGSSRSSVLDRGMSPLTYGGFNGLLSTGFLQQKSKLRHGLILAGELGQLKPGSFENHLSRLISARFEIDHYYMRKLPITSVKNTEFFLGGAVNITGNYREHNRYGNNALNFDLIAAAHLSASLEHNFTLFSKSFTFKYRTSLPVYAHYYRPSYATSKPPGYIDGEERSDFMNAIASGNHAWIGNHFRWQNRFRFIYTLTNGNYLSLNYTWDYFHLRSTHPVQSAVHQLSIGTGFKF